MRMKHIGKVATCLQDGRKFAGKLGRGGGGGGGMCPVFHTPGSAPDSSV